MIPEAILMLVGVVGVSGPKAVLDALVIARTRIGVLDQQSDRRTRTTAFEHAGQNAHRVALASLTDELRGARAAPIDILLQIRLLEA